MTFSRPHGPRLSSEIKYPACRDPNKGFCFSEIHPAAFKKFFKRPGTQTSNPTLTRVDLVLLFLLISGLLMRFSTLVS